MAIALFHIANTRLKPWQVQMMQLFDADDPFEVWSKKFVQLQVGTTILPSSFDTSCAMLHCAESFKTFAMLLNLPTFVLRYRRLKSKTPIGGKFCVTNHEKWEGDFAVFVCECTPGKVLYHTAVLILTRTVVSVQVNFLFAKTMVFQEVVELADYGVGSLTTVTCLIRERFKLPR